MPASRLLKLSVGAPARRAERWLQTSTELRPTRSEEVVLVADIAGISIADFQEAQGTSREQIFLSAAGTRHEPSSFVSGVWAEQDGVTKEERLILVIVPRSIRAFDLHFPGVPPVRFMADIPIAPTLP